MKKFSEWNDLSKQIFWVTLAYAIFGVLNVIAYAVVSHFNLVVVRNLAYVFWLAYMGAILIIPLIYVCTKIKFDLWFVIVIDLFFVLAVLVGSLWRVYHLFDGYDKLVHTLFGVVMAFLAYFLFFKSEKNKGSLIFMFFVLFSFSLMCGAVWEMFEFTADSIITDLDAQVTFGLYGRLAIYNTMFDIICDCGGALLGTIVMTVVHKLKNKQQ